MQWGEVDTLRHKSIEPFGELAQALATQDFCIRRFESKDTRPGNAVRRDGAYSGTAGKRHQPRENVFLAITSQSLLNSHFSNVSVTLLAYYAAIEDL